MVISSIAKSLKSKYVPFVPKARIYPKEIIGQVDIYTNIFIVALYVTTIIAKNLNVQYRLYKLWYSHKIV